MKFCPKCGTKMSDEFNFCPKCGEAQPGTCVGELKEKKLTETQIKSQSIVARLSRIFDKVLKTPLNEPSDYDLNDYKEQIDKALDLWPQNPEAILLEALECVANLNTNEDDLVYYFEKCKNYLNNNNRLEFGRKVAVLSTGYYNNCLIVLNPDKYFGILEINQENYPEIYKLLFARYIDSVDESYQHPMSQLDYCDGDVTDEAHDSMGICLRPERADLTKLAQKKIEEMNNFNIVLDICKNKLEDEEADKLEIIARRITDKKIIDSIRTWTYKFKHHKAIWKEADHLPQSVYDKAEELLKRCKLTRRSK